MAIERTVATYREKGYSEEWITRRLRSIEIRKDLTAEGIGLVLKKVMNMQYSL